MQFEWNQEGFDAFDRHIQKVVPQAAQSVLDDVYERGQGRSADEIKQLLAVEWKKVFGGPADRASSVNVGGRHGSRQAGDRSERSRRVVAHLDTQSPVRLMRTGL